MSEEKLKSGSMAAIFGGAFLLVSAVAAASPFEDKAESCRQALKVAEGNDLARIFD